MDKQVDSELVVTKVALRVRAIYCRLRSVYCAHECNPGRKYDKEWLKVAKWCVAFGINPREYVEVQFKSLKPYPNIKDMTNKSAITRFYECRKTYAAETASTAMIQMAALEKMMSIGRTPHDILTDPHQELDPLFKYLVSACYGLDDLASLFFEEALNVYITSMYFDGIYKDLITEELKAAAKEVRGYGDV